MPLTLGVNVDFGVDVPFVPLGSMVGQRDAPTRQTPGTGLGVCLPLLLQAHTGHRDDHIVLGKMTDSSSSQADLRV